MRVAAVAAAMALAASGGVGGADVIDRDRQRAPALVVGYPLAGGRFDPSWWLRRGAKRNQRELRRDRRRLGT